ncbi:unnamed protein product [Polarella glacialis]|uniref:Uncharacterized protein n=2 Tax=Polarella glacialis TaxID=89957 RepID=A0A813H6J4_POLGL|nr:unnamed protein product [Polarella glacialis]
MDILTPIKAESAGGGCEETATALSELSTCCNFSPETATEDQAGKIMTNMVTFLKKRMLNYEDVESPVHEHEYRHRHEPPDHPHKDPAVSVVENFFKIMEVTNHPLLEADARRSSKASPSAEKRQATYQASAASQASVASQASQALQAQGEAALEAQLQSTRIELERTAQEAKAAAGLRKQQVQLVAAVSEAQEREARSMHESSELEWQLEEAREKAKREAETYGLQQHIFEVEISRVESNLRRATSRVEALEKELKKKAGRRPSTSEVATAGRGQFLPNTAVKRHELAARMSFRKDEDNARPRADAGAFGWLGFCSTIESAKKPAR